MQSLLQQFASSNFLITTTEWFYAPDGNTYRAVWGKVKICKDEETLGIKTNIRSANWYAVVGEGEKQTIVAGCQIHYACICNNTPFTGERKQLKVFESLGKQEEIRIENGIYLAQ